MKSPWSLGDAYEVVAAAQVEQAITELAPRYVGNAIGLLLALSRRGYRIEEIAALLPLLERRVCGE